MPKLNTLSDLLVDQLRDLYSAETQLLQALPDLAAAAGDQDLRDGFEEHLQQTREHVERLKRVLKSLGADPAGGAGDEDMGTGELHGCSCARDRAGQAAVS